VPERSEGSPQETLPLRFAQGQGDKKGLFWTSYSVILSVSEESHPFFTREIFQLDSYFA
jgi:ribosomal protein L31